MIEEKDAAVPLTSSQYFWRNLIKHSTTLHGDTPVPIAEPEPPKPEQEPDEERTLSAELLYAYASAMQRSSIMGHSQHRFDWRPLEKYRTNWNAYRSTVGPPPELPALAEFDGQSQFKK